MMLKMDIFRLITDYYRFAECIVAKKSIFAKTINLISLCKRKNL
jgi:hypothetical protein